VKIFIANNPDMHQNIANWVADRIPHVTDFENATTIGVTSDSGIPIGAVVYHDYRDKGVQLSCASDSPRWLSKSVLNSIFKYPFEQLECMRVTALAPSRNSHTRKFLEKLGFVQEGVMRKGFLEDDCVVYGMLRDECEWIKGNNHG
jgi:RimJ/RimL family protein N-acetyltransferase